MIIFMLPIPGILYKGVIIILVFMSLLAQFLFLETSDSYCDYISLVVCLSPTSHITVGPESGLDTSSTVKELGEDVTQGRVPGEHCPLFSPSSCDFIRSLSLSSTRLKGELQCFSES